MQCPCGSSLVVEGNFQCERGAANYHKWSGGGLLVSPCGSFMWRQEEERWEVVTESSGAKVADGPDKPESGVIVSTARGKLVITVSLVVDLTGLTGDR